MKRKKELIILFLILLLGSVLRFWGLGQIPFGATLDEMGYIFNSYSISLTGENVFGQSLPLFTWMVPNGFPFMPVPIYLSAIFFRLFDLSLTTGRLLAAILGIFDIFLVFAIVYYLFNKKSLALLSALFLAISPWHLHFSRSAYDPNYSLFFYLFGITLFFWEIKRKRLPFFSIASFLLALFSYRGMSLIGIPLFLLLAVYAWYGLRASKKQIIYFCVGIITIMLILGSVVMFYKSSYTAEGTAIFNNQKMTESINNMSREAQGPLFLKRFFINKPSFIINTFKENFIKAFSPEFLFLYTEPYAIYAIWSRGRIYFIDLLFIAFGLWYLLHLKKKESLFLILLLLIGALPGVIGGYPISARNLFQSALYPILTAGGVLFFVEQKLLSKIKYLVMGVIIIVYSYAMGSYLFDYYGKYAFQQAEAWGESYKDVSTYVLENSQKYKSVFIGPTSHGDFVQFAFYAKLKPQEVQSIWRSSKKDYKGPFQYKSITFLPECSLREGMMGRDDSLYITRETCNKTATPSAVIRDYFGNTLWNIYYKN